MWPIYQLGKNYLGPHKYTYSFGVPLGHLRENYRLTEDKTIPVEAWVKDLMALNKTSQGNFECFMGTLVSTVPAVWQGPLHYRNLQSALLISLKKGLNKFRSVSITHQLVRELKLWASGGLRVN